MWMFHIGRKCITSVQKNKEENYEVLSNEKRLAQTTFFSVTYASFSETKRADLRLLLCNQIPGPHDKSGLISGSHDSYRILEAGISLGFNKNS
jgi:hypothetical protein